MRFDGPASPFGHLVLLGGSVLLPFAIGTLGFHWIEGVTLFESFYMTLITLTTIGYREAIELSEWGRYFNSGLILIGFGVIFVGIGILGEYLIAYRVLDRVQQGVIRRMLRRTSNHYIICGLGRVGLGVLGQLRLENAKVVVIDKSGGKEKAFGEDIDVPVLAADATLPQSLEVAGIRSAKGLVAALSSDADNVYVTLSGRVMNPRLRIVARASTEDAKNRLLQAGADRVVMPHAFTGRRLAQGMLRPHSLDFLEITGTPKCGPDNLELGECRLSDDSFLVGRTLEQAALPEKLGLIPVALSDGTGPPKFNPPPSARLSEGNVLLVIGPRAAIDKLNPDSGAK